MIVLVHLYTRLINEESQSMDNYYIDFIRFNNNMLFITDLRCYKRQGFYKNCNRNDNVEHY
jgi:hypothetical protein